MTANWMLPQHIAPRPLMRSHFSEKDRRTECGFRDCTAGGLKSALRNLQSAILPVILDSPLRL